MKRDIQIIRESIGRIVNMLTARRLKVTQRGTMAFVAYDKKTGAIDAVNLPYLPDDASDDFVAAIQGFLDHEVGHILHTDQSVVLKAGKLGPRVSNTHNLIEDCYIERKMSEQFRGSSSNLDVLRKFYFEKVCHNKMKEALAEGDVDHARGFAMVFAYRAWAGQPFAQEMMKDPEIAELVKPVADKLGPALIEQLRYVNSSQEALDLSKKFVKALERVKPPAPPAPPPPPIEEKSEPEPKEKEEEDDERAPEGAEPGEPSGDPDDDTDPADADGTTTAPKSEDAPVEEEDLTPPTPEEADAGDDEGEGVGEPDDLALPPEETPPPSDSDESEEDGGDDDGEEGGAGGEGSEGKGDDDGEPEPEKLEDDVTDTGSSAAPEAGVGDEAEETDAGGDDDATEVEDDSPRGEDDAESERDVGDGKPGPGADDAPIKGDAPATPKPADGSLDTIPKGGEAEEEPVEEEDLGGAADERHDFDDEVSEALTEVAVREMGEADYRIFSTEFDVIEAAPECRNPASVAEMVDETIAAVGVMQKHLERAMAARNRKAWNPGMRRGRIAPGALFRTGVGDDRVFRTRTETRAKNTVVSLLDDCSGSMGGRKIHVAATASYALSATLERLKIRHEVLGFTTTRRNQDAMAEAYAEEVRRGKAIRYARMEPLYMPVFKGYDERLDARVKSRFAALREGPSWLRENIDGECVAIAGHRLRQQTAERHVLIVLSDGSPACATGAGSIMNRHLKSTVAALEADGVEVIGVGLMTRVVENFYPKSLVLTDASELATTLVTQLTKLLLED